MKTFLQLIGLLFCIVNSISSLPCLLRDCEYGMVCVCNETYCDNLDELDPKGPNEFILVSSSADGLRFAVKNGTFDNTKLYQVGDLKLSNSIDEILFSLLPQKTVHVQINRDLTYQRMEGFGGAVTGAVSHLLNDLPKSLRHKIYESYFSQKTGIGYNFIRTPIGGCDFDLIPWAYNEYPINDVNLSNFTKLDPRDELKIRFLNEIKSISYNHDIRLLASAWSPPPWMKTNNAWTGFSSLKSEYYQTWANYHFRYLELMASKNITFWAITTGNEPTGGNVAALVTPFMSLGWSPQNQGKWLKENLGPLIKQSQFAHVKIFSNDDQRFTYPLWFIGMNEGASNSTNYIDGFAVHWYWDALVPPIALDSIHAMYPDKIILNTESCVGDKPWEHHGPELGNWNRAEKYITSYIQDFQHWVSGWIDWNLILNEIGGPNYVKNYVDSPVIVNMTSKNEFYKQPIFYAIGHFSKFIHRNSLRIDSRANDVDVQVVAFRRPDENIVVILYNKKKYPVNIEISDSHHVNSLQLNIPPKSIHTIVYK